MSIRAFRGTCLHCGHDHDADNAAFQAFLTQSETAAYPQDVLEKAREFKGRADDAGFLARAILTATMETEK